ncbi:MAG: hypothetical protein ACYDAJ_03315 [Nitrosotalea sp.]
MTIKVSIRKDIADKVDRFPSDLKKRIKDVLKELERDWPMTRLDIKKLRVTTIITEFVLAFTEFVLAFTEFVLAFTGFSFSAKQERCVFMMCQCEVMHTSKFDRRI